MSRLDRQSFLGPDSDAVLDAATIGLVGLGGGGSHVVQQTAHMGIGGYANADSDIIEDTNTNRLIGGAFRAAMSFSRWSCTAMQELGRMASSRCSRNIST
jgi:tRNA A37 threonylcarbamoyladenosine dehydratase